MLEVVIVLVIVAVTRRDGLRAVSYDSVDEWVRRKESTRGVFRTGLTVSGFMILAAGFNTRLSSHASFVGKYYAQMASDPFAFDPSNPVPHRILTSLISYLIGLRGQLVIVTNLLIAAALIYLVYRYFRKYGPRPGDALVAAACVAFSLVTLGTVYYGGYNDSLTYLLIFAMWTQRERPMRMVVLFLLALFNRETVIFLVPWLLYESVSGTRQKTVRGAGLLAGFMVAVGIYLGFRYLLSQQGEIGYSLAYYLEPFLDDPLHMARQHLSNLWLSVFSVFKVLWIVPLAAGLAAWRRGDRRLVWSMILLLVCVSAQLFFAYDTSRMLTMGFMVLILSLGYLFTMNVFDFRRWVGWLFLFHLLIPNITVAGAKIDMMHSLLWYILLKALSA